MEIITIETHEAFVKAEKVHDVFLSYSTKQSTLLELFKSHNEDAQKLLGISKNRSHPFKILPGLSTFMNIYASKV